MKLYGSGCYFNEHVDYGYYYSVQLPVKHFDCIQLGCGFTLSNIHEITTDSLELFDKQGKTRQQLFRNWNKETEQHLN